MWREINLDRANSKWKGLRIEYVLDVLGIVSKQGGWGKNSQGERGQTRGFLLGVVWEDWRVVSSRATCFDFRFLRIIFVFVWSLVWEWRQGGSREVGEKAVGW